MNVANVIFHDTVNSGGVSLKTDSARRSSIQYVDKQTFIVIVLKRLSGLFCRVQKTNTALKSFGAYASRKLGDIRYILCIYLLSVINSSVD
jgi:hypothetical protein